MRGKVLRLLHWQSEKRITPAYAGKRLLCVIFGFFYRDHPRLCGEKRLALP